jgi:hypothetical protein
MLIGMIGAHHTSPDQSFDKSDKIGADSDQFSEDCDRIHPGGYAEYPGGGWVYGWVGAHGEASADREIGTYDGVGADGEADASGGAGRVRR